MIVDVKMGSLPLPVYKKILVWFETNDNGINFDFKNVTMDAGNRYIRSIAMTDEDYIVMKLSIGL